MTFRYRHLFMRATLVVALFLGLMQPVGAAAGQIEVPPRGVPLSVPIAGESERLPSSQRRNQC